MGLTSLLEQDKLVRGGASPMMTAREIFKFIESAPKMYASALSKAKPIVKAHFKKLKGKGLTDEEARKKLIDDGNEPDIVDEFLAAHVESKGWRKGIEAVKNAFKSWYSQKPSAEKKKKNKKEKKESKKPEKKEPEKKEPEVIAIDPSAPAPAPAPTVAPRSTMKGIFRLTEKEFDNIKNTKPKLEYRRLLKDFFNELSITKFGSLPGNFVSDINALGLRSGSRDEETIDKLRSTLSSYRTLLSQKEPAKETKIKLQVAEAPKPKRSKINKPKKALLKKDRKNAPRVGTVRKIPVVKSTKKKVQRKKAPKKKPTKKDTSESIKVLI
jgi:hypothetical protein